MASRSFLAVRNLKNCPEYKFLSLLYHFEQSSLDFPKIKPSPLSIIFITRKKVTTERKISLRSSLENPKETIGRGPEESIHNDYREINTVL